MGKSLGRLRKQQSGVKSANGGCGVWAGRKPRPFKAINWGYEGEFFSKKAFNQ